MAGIDRVKYPSLPSNYVSIADLKERWLKEKERKQQEEKEKQENEEKKKYPVLQNHQNRIANRCIHSRASVGKNLQKRENLSGKGWREVGLIANEPKLKEVKISASVVEEGVDGTRGKEKMGYFGKREARVESDGSGDMAKFSIIDVAEEEMMAVVSVENGGKESSKGKCKWNSENKEVQEVAAVCMVEVVGESNVDREIAGQNCGVGFRGKKNGGRKMGVRIGEVSDKAHSAEQSGQKHNAGKEVVSADVKERTTEKVRVGGAFRAYGDKEMASVDVKVVGESNVNREIAGQKCRVGYRGNKNSWRKMGGRVGEVSDKADSVEQSGQKHNAGKEKFSVDVKERTNEKVRVSSAFRAYGDNEVASVCTVEVVGENKVDREITGQNCGVGFRGKKNGGRKMGARGDDVNVKADSGEQSGQELDAEKEKVSVDVVDVKERTTEKVRVGGAFRAYGDNEVASVDVEVVGENKVDREIAGQNCGVGFRGKKNSWRKMGARVGEVSNKADSVEQSGQKHNAGKEVVPVDVKERTNEKVRVRGAYRVKKNNGKQMVDRVGEVSDKADTVEQSGLECNAEKEKVSVNLKERTNKKVRVKGAFCAYGDKEVEEVATVCTVEVVEEIKVDRKIAGQKCRVGYRGEKHSRRKMANRVGEVSNKADSAEQSGQEINAEKKVVLVDVKERTNEKARVRGAFRAYSDKSKYVLIDSEDGLKMTIESDLGDLSLTDRRYGHGRSSVGVYGRYESSRRYEPRKMLKLRDNSFVWIKKGESSNGNVAEIETQG